MKRKTLFLSLLALVLIVCAMVQPALAYFTANTQADGKIPLNFGYETKIEEGYKDFVKTVTIQNTGEAGKADPIWVRARAYSGSTYPLVPTVAEPWYYGGDNPDGTKGWYYYRTPLMPQETTKGTLSFEITGIPDKEAEDHDFTQFNVAVVYESITAYYKFDANGQPDGFEPADWTAKKLDTGSSSPAPSASPAPVTP